MKNVLFLISSLFLLGCATMSKEQCQTMDWHEAGKIDGEKGQYRDYYKQHQSSCEESGGKVATDLYFAGWEEGHKKYCTAENGYKAGVDGRYSADICSAEEYPEYREQFKVGRGVNQLLEERNKIEEQIDKSHEDQSALMNISRAVAIWNGKSPTESLDNRRSELNDKIMAIESNAPGGPQVPASPTQSLSSLYSTASLPDIQHSLGAFIGTFIGFGSGHAIQGRYGESGWKWTAAEVGTLSLAAIAGSRACATTTPELVTTPDGRSRVDHKCTGDTGPAFVGFLTFLAVRIWASYDLFTYNNKKTNPYPSTSQGVIVKPDGLAWVYNF